MQVEHLSFDLFVRFQQFGRPLRNDAFHGSRDLFYLLSPSQRARRLSLWTGKSWDLGMHLDHVTRANPSMQFCWNFSSKWKRLRLWLEQLINLQSMDVRMSRQMEADDAIRRPTCNNSVEQLVFGPVTQATGRQVRRAGVQRMSQRWHFNNFLCWFFADSFRCAINPT